MQEHTPSDPYLVMGWFNCTELSLSTYLLGKQGMQGAYALVRGS